MEPSNENDDSCLLFLRAAPVTRVPHTRTSAEQSTPQAPLIEKGLAPTRECDEERAKTKVPKKEEKKNEEKQE